MKSRSFKLFEILDKGQGTGDMDSDISFVYREASWSLSLLSLYFFVSRGWCLRYPYVHQELGTWIQTFLVYREASWSLSLLSLCFFVSRGVFEIPIFIAVIAFSFSSKTQAWEFHSGVSAVNSRCWRSLYSLGVSFLVGKYEINCSCQSHWNCKLDIVVGEVQSVRAVC